MTGHEHIVARVPRKERVDSLEFTRGEKRAGEKEKYVEWGKTHYDNNAELANAEIQNTESNKCRKYRVDI